MEKGERIRPEAIQTISAKHEGKCFRNSHWSPAVAEEHQAELVGRDLMIGGDNVAMFAISVNSDGDTKAAKNLIHVQNLIIGEAADNKADINRDRGHIIKCHNNGMFNLMEKDKTFKGTNLLNATRIKSINSDIQHVIESYEKIFKDPDTDESKKAEARKECLEQLYAIPRHHCGDHTHCNNEQLCTYRKVEKEHPDWMPHQIAEQAEKESRRPYSKQMDLSPHGIETLIDKIRQRFNENTIDKIAEGGCTNLSESFWNVLVKFSEGKRLNLNLTDLWEVMCMLTFCRIGDGNVEKTHDKMSTKLGIPVTSAETKFLKRSAKKAKKNKARQITPEAKQRRALRKMTKTIALSKEEAKKAHKTGKVPISESAKSCVGKAGDKKSRKSPCCTNCGLPGHNKKICKMPPKRKRPPIDLMDFDMDLLNLIGEYESMKYSKRRRCKS